MITSFDIFDPSREAISGREAWERVGEFNYCIVDSVKIYYPLFFFLFFWLENLFIYNMNNWRSHTSFRAGPYIVKWTTALLVDF